MCNPQNQRFRGRKRSYILNYKTLSVSISAARIGYRDLHPLPFLSSISAPPLHPWTVTKAVTVDGCGRPIAPTAEQTSLICQNTDVPSWQLRRGALNPVKPNKGVCPLFVMRPARHLPPMPLHSLHKQDKTAVRATLTLMYELESVGAWFSTLLWRRANQIITQQPAEETATLKLTFQAFLIIPAGCLTILGLVKSTEPAK